jgi:hypothetical protein
VVEREERTPEGEERLVDVGTPLVADRQPTHLVQVRERALHDPAVSPQTCARVHAAAGDPGESAASAERAPGLREVVRFVRVQLGGPALRSSRPAPHRTHGVDQLREAGDLVAVRRREELGERDALAVGDEVALRARARSVRRIGPGRLLGDRSLPFARMMEASTTARSQSRHSAPFSRAGSTCRSRSQTPAWCQSRSRRQQVIPEPQPIFGTPAGRRNRPGFGGRAMT